MTADPYHAWLGIPPNEQPPNHYRLLGLTPFESNPDVISQAADQRSDQVRAAQAGQPADLIQRMLNEIAGAKLCLLDPNAKLTYDADLATRTPRPSPAQLTGLPVPPRRVGRRSGPSLVLLFLAGAGLVLATGTGALLALWWLSNDSGRTPPQDRTASSSHAVASSQDRAASPASSKQVDDPAKNRTITPESRKTAGVTQVVPPPVVRPPAVVIAPVRKKDLSTAGQVQKGKGKKKVAKEPAQSVPTWKTNVAGYPVIAAKWLGANKQTITIVQQRDQFTATGVVNDSKHGDILWRWAGTVDKEGHLNGRLVYTSAPSNFVDRDVSATLTPDGKTIRGKSGKNPALPDLPWKKKKKGKTSTKSK